MKQNNYVLKKNANWKDQEIYFDFLLFIVYYSFIDFSFFLSLSFL